MAWNESLNQARVNEKLRLGWLKVIEAFLRFLERIAADRNLSYKADRTAIDAVNALKVHVEHGGGLRSSVIDTKDAAVFKDCLKYLHVTYSCSEMLTNTGETKTVFTTKDKDADLVEKAVNMLVAELGTGLSMLPVQDFLNRTRDVKIERISNLSEVEAVVFQQNLASYDVTYSINRVSADKYEMLYMPKDAVIMREAAINTAYDLSGETGTEYAQNLKKELDKEHSFEKSIEGALKQRIKEFGKAKGRLEDMPVVYVVDSRNPNNFIAVTEEAFSTHSLHDREMTDMVGEVSHFIEDVSIVYGAEERSTIMKYVNQLDAPVIINSIEELGIIGKFRNHSLTLLDSDTTREREISLFEKLKNRKDTYQRERLSSNLKPDGKIFTMHNLPDDVIYMINDMIQTEALCHTVTDGNSVAYTAPDNKILNELLEKALYKDVKSNLEYYERKLRYSGAGEVHFLETHEETVYILDINNKSFEMQLDEQGLSLHISGEEITRIEKEDIRYPDILSTIMEQIESPVVLSAQEYDSPEREEIISKRTPQMLAGSYEPLLSEVTEKERKELVAVVAGASLESPTKRQEAALRMNNSWEYSSILVDEYYISKTLGIAADERIRESDRNYGVAADTVSTDLYPDIGH